MASSSSNQNHLTGSGFPPSMGPRFQNSPMRPFGQHQYMGGPPGPRPNFPPGINPTNTPGGHPPPHMAPSTPRFQGSPYPPPTAKSKNKEKTDIDKGMSGRPNTSAALQHALEQRKRPGPDRGQHVARKKRPKLADKIISRHLGPESQAYMDLLAYERKLDSVIARKKLQIAEALKRPLKQKRKLRIFISNTLNSGRTDADGGEESGPWWELRVEGRLIDENNEGAKPKQKFSTFFKSLVIELDKELYGPDNHLVEWHRTPKTSETDGFQVKRSGDQNVKCTVLLMLDYQPLKYKLDPRLARLLGIHTESRPQINNALWQYVKQHKLQDPNEREYINCDRFLAQIFDTNRLKFAELPTRLHPLLSSPEPIVINHTIVVEGPDAAKKVAAYDIEIEVDDPKKIAMNQFLLSAAHQQEMTAEETKINEVVDEINQLKQSRDFFQSFSADPQQFMTNWLISQSRDLKTVTDVAGCPEQERKAEFYQRPPIVEGVNRYFYNQVQQRKNELEQTLGIK